MNLIYKTSIKNLRYPFKDVLLCAIWYYFQWTDALGTVWISVCTLLLLLYLTCLIYVSIDPYLVCQTYKIICLRMSNTFTMGWGACKYSVIGVHFSYHSCSNFHYHFITTSCRSVILIIIDICKKVIMPQNSHFNIDNNAVMVSGSAQIIVS